MGTAQAPAGNPPKPRKKSRSWVWLLVLCLAGIAGYRYFPQVTQGASKFEKAEKTPAKRAAPAVPVVAATARRSDLSIYLTGLGSVAAYNTVTIRARVDGELMHVAFTEGQLVQKGDLLAEIDPRPFQAQLSQAEGQLARDQANLANARLDLQRYQ